MPDRRKKSEQFFSLVCSSVSWPTINHPKSAACARVWFSVALVHCVKPFAFPTPPLPTCLALVQTQPEISENG